MIVKDALPGLGGHPRTIAHVSRGSVDRDGD
jgi:hypothetical protein